MNRRMTGFIGLLAVLVAAEGAAAGEEAFRKRRLGLTAEIAEDVRRTSRYIGREHFGPAVMQVMARVPRHEFVPPALQEAAYENRPLPIGYGQTISQPYIVALMTDLLDLRPDHRVLELGTGSGYQAAVLAELVKQVYTIEIVPELGEQARRRLARLGYRNAAVHIGDGYYGLPEQAPFDAVIVTAAANHVPPPLLRQLKPGGRMVIPVGAAFMTQQLMLVEKTQDGRLTTRQILPVIFVPLTGGHE